MPRKDFARLRFAQTSAVGISSQSRQSRFGADNVGEPQTIRDAPPPSGGKLRGTVRVLHVINGDVYSGAERVQDLLALGLDAFGFEVGFACLKPGRFVEMRQAKDAPLHEVPMWARFDLLAARRVARILRREGYSLVHSHTPRSALIASLASRLTGVPLVHHIHSPSLHDTTYPWRSWLNAVVERRSLGRASALIAVSESLGNFMRRRGFCDEVVTVVPNGVPSRKLTLRRETPKQTWTLGTVALFRPRKGVEVLLRSLALLRSQGLPVRLRAVGSFETVEYERATKRLAEELGVEACVDWTGFTRDVDSELARMDVFVLPSLFGEGLPMVVLEAMAAGVPVVATRVEGTPEAIRDGEDGLIAEPNNPRCLAETLGPLIRGDVDWRALRASALKRHAERFSETAMAAGVAEVYRRVLAGMG